MNQIPGMIFTGQVSHPLMNQGQPVPLYCFADRPGGINTLEGWNTLANRINRRSFVLANGREPMNDAELRLWVKEAVA